MKPHTGSNRLTWQQQNGRIKIELRTAIINSVMPLVASYQNYDSESYWILFALLMISF